MMDLIADMLTRIRNANQRYHKTLSMPSSKMLKAIADVLVAEGYLHSAEERDGTKKVLVLELKYKGKRGKDRVIVGLERMSRLSRRAYTNVDNIPAVFNGLGVCILSTPQGVMTGHEARKRRVGGEMLCKVW